MNDLHPTRKLEWALQMAESVALMHNNLHGVIVHDDVQPFQWMIGDDGNVKANDFNRAVSKSLFSLGRYHAKIDIPTLNCCYRIGIHVV